MLYTITPCTGGGFITHDDRGAFEVQGFGSDVWVTDESQAAHDWIARIGATEITKDEAQAVINAAFDASGIVDTIHNRPQQTEPQRLP